MSEQKTLSMDSMVAAFNEWMRRYVEDPSAFMAEFESVIQFQKDKQDGAEPSYGQISAAYMFQLSDELTASRELAA